MYVTCNSATVGCSAVSRSLVSVSGITGTSHYLRVAFNTSAVLQPGQSTQVDISITRQYSGLWDETNDYSWENASTFIAAPKITLYQNSVLVWGTEPGTTAPVVYICGNGTLDPGEVCDPGEYPDHISATCDRDCTLPVCGDGVFNSAAGEVCEPSLMSGCKDDCSGYEEGGGPTPPPSCTDWTECLHVQHKITDSYTDNAIRPNFKLVNNTDEGVAFNEMTVRYWFTSEPTGTLESWCDYAALLDWTSQCSSIQRSVVPVSGRVGADYYLELTFNNALTLPPATSTNDIQLRVSETPYYGNFNEYDDWSNTKSGAYTADVNATIYRGGVLVWGVEPEEEL